MIEPLTIIRSAIGAPYAVGFLNFLRENGFRVIGTDIIPVPRSQDYVDGFYVVPRAGEGQPVMDAYQGIINKEKASWIISGPELEVQLLMRQCYQLEPAHVFHAGSETLDIITDKWRLWNELKKDAQLKMPLTSQLEDMVYPADKVVLKPAQGRGSTGVYIVEPGEFVKYKNFLSGQTYLVQPFIAGQEFTVDFLCDQEGKLLNAVSRIRLKTDSGISIMAQTVRDEALLELTTVLTQKFKFFGGNCVQFIKSEDHHYYLTDINPRFGGGSILSLKASRSFQQNLINLLQGRNDQLKQNVFDFESLTMNRIYHEIYY